jgi:hypothetical protein
LGKALSGFTHCRDLTGPVQPPAFRGDAPGIRLAAAASSLISPRKAGGRAVHRMAGFPKAGRGFALVRPVRNQECRVRRPLGAK